MINKTKNEIEKIANDIIAEFGPECLILKYQTLCQDERCALFLKANVLIITSMRDGVSLLPFEFISMKKKQGSFHKSSIIMSEFSGVAKSMSGVNLINPYDIDSIT